jgi:hypothetical protein
MKGKGKTTRRLCFRQAPLLTMPFSENPGSFPEVDEGICHDMPSCCFEDIFLKQA